MVHVIYHAYCREIFIGNVQSEVLCGLTTTSWSGGHYKKIIKISKQNLWKRIKPQGQKQRHLPHHHDDPANRQRLDKKELGRPGWPSNTFQRNGSIAVTWCRTVKIFTICSKAQKLILDWQHWYMWYMYMFCYTCVLMVLVWVLWKCNPRYTGIRGMHCVQLNRSPRFPEDPEGMAQICM